MKIPPLAFRPFPPAQGGFKGGLIRFNQQNAMCLLTHLLTPFAALQRNESLIRREGELDRWSSPSIMLERGIPDQVGEGVSYGK